VQAVRAGGREAVYTSAERETGVSRGLLLLSIIINYCNSFHSLLIIFNNFYLLLAHILFDKNFACNVLGFV